MPTWDRRTPSALAKLRDRAVRDQVRDVVAPFSPFWRDRFAEIGLKPSAVDRVSDLGKLPPVGERDVCPDGDPSRAARLVVQASETGYALHAPGPALRKALLQRAFDIDAYRRHIEADSRATSYVYDGLGFRFPIASTRSDLDLIARAGARLWQVLGLGPSDVLVSAGDLGATTAHVALQYAALGAGSPALFPGSDPEAIAETLRLVPATVLAAPTSSAVTIIDEIADIGAPIETLTTLLLIGAPTGAERDAVRHALLAAGAPNVVVLGLHAPSGARVLWGECRQTTAGVPTGFHTYPDLEVVQLIDPETGEAAGPAGGPGELVLTQLGFRGSALLRWRTADLVDGDIETGTCPACGRIVPRVPAAIRRGALVAAYKPRNGGAVPVDFRGVAGALVGLADVKDWRAVLRRSQRHGGDELLTYVEAAADADPAEVTVAAARDLRMVAGVLPSQIVAASRAELADVDVRANGLTRLTPRISIRV
jgi:phenylacetate-coenzyme A ligase PaaK-like adenylate-forming protein